MMESLVLFDSVVNSRWFMRTSIILFLNKVDLFRQKLPRSPLNKYFPDYSGGNDVNRAAKYLLWRFNQVNRAHLNLYPQYVSATQKRFEFDVLTFRVQSNSSHRHHEHSACLCGRQGDNIAECLKRFRHFVKWKSPCCIPLRRSIVSYTLPGHCLIYSLPVTSFPGAISDRPFTIHHLIQLLNASHLPFGQAAGVNGSLLIPG